MSDLIDSQAVIWYVDQDHLLTTVAHAAIADPANDPCPVRRHVARCR
jgi:hypothetical protein